MELRHYFMQFSNFKYFSTELEDDEANDEYLVVSKAELRRLDAQPNPFNFSERVTQTVKIVYKVRKLCFLS